MQRTLTTNRITLRPLAPVDDSWLSRFWNMPEINRNTASIPSHVDEDFARQRIQSAIEGEEAQTNIERMVEIGEQRAGLIGLKRSTPGEAFGLSYALHPDFWGQGIATEAGVTLLGWSDSFASPRYYISGHFADNPASGAVLRKLGFLPCWRGPVHCVARDEKVDHLYMSRLI